MKSFINNLINKFQLRFLYVKNPKQKEIELNELFWVYKNM